MQMLISICPSLSETRKSFNRRLQRERKERGVTEREGGKEREGEKERGGKMEREGKRQR